MISVRRILVPVDFSEPSQRAVDYGLSLALQFNSRLLLAHIVPYPSALIYTFPTESFAFEKEQARYAKSMLPDLVSDDYRERVDLQTIVKVGDVRNELLGIVKDEKIDLVVMGTHGRNAFERLVLGSLTERMLRKLNVPILTVSHLDPARELHKGGPVPLSHILYATDLSENAEVGLKFSIDLARGTGARLTVLNVMDDFKSAYFDGEILDRLRCSVSDEAAKDVRISPMVSEGEPYREIIRIAEETKADLIVMNLQGKNLVDRALLGSTAERVVRCARIPVLSIPIHAEIAREENIKETIVA